MGSLVNQAVLESKPLRLSASVAVIAERRYLTHAQPRGMIEGLNALGHSVLVIDPEDQAFDAGDGTWMRRIEVAVARGRSWSVLCLLEWLERQSVPVINPRSAIAAVHNKAEMTVRLASARIPIPRTFLGTPRVVARQLAAADFPVIVKPVFGDNCRGLKIAHSPEELAGLEWPESLAIIQKFIPGTEFDLKLYCIGREVWAVRKPSPLAQKFFPGAPQQPCLVPLEPALRNLALQCGDVFGLVLFGVDCIETDDGPLVIEVNEFPNYSAVPGADEKLAEFVISSRHRRER
jgi:glutathione synthase/RimK-type ligase-like ATP-grasp enzyme